MTFQGRSNISHISLSPDQQTLLQIDIDGYAQLILLKNDAVLAYFNFHEPVHVAKFSPDNRFLSLGLGCKLKVFECAFYNKKFLGALLPHLSFSSWHSDQIRHLDYFGPYLITTSNDQTIRLCHLGKEKGYIPITLTGHRKPVIGAFPTSTHIFSVSTDARVFVWEWEDASERFLKAQEADYHRRLGRKASSHSNTQQLTLKKKHQLQHEGVYNLTSVCMQGGMLVAGFKTGTFALYSVSELEIVVLHTLNMTEYEINFITINPTGDWIAFASQTLGQLLVWEWKSESYILRQMGHSSQLLSAAFTPDGLVLATGGIDGKVKLWEKGICYASFTEHTNSVVEVLFCKVNTLVSCSKDGTVRGYDTTRYKQFRVLTTAETVEFTCLAADKSGEIICAGGMDASIYVWALPTGLLCDVLTGHTSPVSCIGFLQTGMLVSGSWDKTIKVWDVFESKGGCETIDVSGHVVAITCRSDGKEIAASLANGEISIWTMGDLQENSIIEGGRDVAGGRGKNDRFTAKNNPNNKRFNSLAYSPDGTMLLAAGQSKYLCIYDLKHKVLLQRIAYTENRSLSGILHKLNSKEMTEAGPKSELQIEDYNVEMDLDDQGIPINHRPGVLFDKSLEVKASKVVYASTGRTFGVVTTEGLLVYSLDDSEQWLPMSLSLEVSKPNVVQSLVKEEYTTAVIMAMQLGDEKLSKDVILRVPASEISQVVQQVQGKELIALVELLGIEVSTTSELGLFMVWVKEICRTHSKKLRGRTEVRNLLRNLAKKYRELAWLTQDNTYILQYLSREN